MPISRASCHSRSYSQQEENNGQWQFGGHFDFRMQADELERQVDNVATDLLNIATYSMRWPLNHTAISSIYWLKELKERKLAQTIWGRRYEQSKAGYPKRAE